jgi:hypothetical protein
MSLSDTLSANYFFCFFCFLSFVYFVFELPNVSAFNQSDSLVNQFEELDLASVNASCLCCERLVVAVGRLRADCLDVVEGELLCLCDESFQCDGLRA